MAMRKPKPLDQDGLMEYAGRALAARAQSISELRTRLTRRAQRKEDVEEVMSRLKQAGVLNDRRFADSFVNWRRENQGFGKARVMRDLMAGRVAPAVAQQAVTSSFQETDELALIQRYLERKYRGKNLGALLAEEKHLAAAFRKLPGAG